MSDREAFEKCYTGFQVKWNGHRYENTKDTVKSRSDSFFMNDSFQGFKHGIASMQAENDELKAHIDYLVRVMLAEVVNIEAGLDNSVARLSVAAKQQTPSQSLAAHDAALIERVKRQCSKAAGKKHCGEAPIHSIHNLTVAECQIAIEEMEVKP